MKRPQEEEQIGAQVLFGGLVQGVGFRFTTVNLAAGYQVAGTVRNLPDGRVEVIAEGERGEVERFLEAVRRRMARYIRGEVENRYPPGGSYRGFRVAF